MLCYVFMLNFTRFFLSIYPNEQSYFGNFIGIDLESYSVL
ncbi:hypothetical protein EMIT040CA3_150006 [Bacillus pseudomycoides]